jgi:hypothetical protein
MVLLVGVEKGERAERAEKVVNAERLKGEDVINNINISTLFLTSNANFCGKK